MLIASHGNIWLGWKGLPRANTLASWAFMKLLRIFIASPPSPAFAKVCSWKNLAFFRNSKTSKRLFTHPIYLVSQLSLKKEYFEEKLRNFVVNFCWKKPDEDFEENIDENISQKLKFCPSVSEECKVGLAYNLIRFVVDK